MYSKTEKETNPFLVGIAALHEAREYQVWPENMVAINLFSSISTQWRSLGSGPSGLDYNVLFHRLDRMKLSEQDYGWLFDDVRVIESEALSIITKKD